MDTVMGDGLHTNQLDREFFLILPFLIVGQLWQLHNSYILYELYQAQDPKDKEWQIAVTALLFLILGFGNMFTTLKTWISKRLRVKEKDDDIIRKGRYGSSGQGPLTRSITPPPPAVRSFTKQD
ncbi:hypothetical protein HK098_006854 [Nowakowskiella sp. JEL0407]|nr:hypothetical protein HK098_006854 [Nowakowskiella sp. JEL0407]